MSAPIVISMSRMVDPVSFTLALRTRAEMDRTDAPVSSAIVERAVPFYRADEEPLPPPFFQMVHQMADIKRKGRPS